MTNELPKKIEELADKICLNLNEIENLEEALKFANKKQYAMEKELSELLDISGFTVGSKIELKNGRSITLKDYFKASIPAQSTIDKCKDPIKKQELLDKKENCLKWLDENNLGDIIKNNIVADLPRGSKELAEEISKMLSEKQVSHVKEESVHHSTLTATLNDHVKKGNMIPFDIFSVQIGTKLVIK
jgi:hypothetical protein